MTVDDKVIIVSGLPRSGTSMIMQMLKAGGIELIYDELRPVDQSNPNGYFELEKVKSLAEDNSWIPNCKGKAIKILYHLLKYLPKELDYKIIFMHRNLADVITSQDKILASYNKPVDPNREHIKSLFEAQLLQTIGWLDQQNNMEVIDIQFSDVISKPKKISLKISEFLGTNLDLKAMGTVVNSALVSN